MRRRTALVLGGIVALAVGLGAYTVALSRRGFSALDEPSAPEKLVARVLRRCSAPTDLRHARNPLKLTDAVLKEAREHFADHCATCHGNDGKGDGALGRTMYPKTPNMTLAETQSLSDGELFSIIENGVRLTGMPAFGSGTAESARGSWTLVHFIRHLPKLTAEEIAEMQALNPKSPAEWRELAAEESFLQGDSKDAAPERTSKETSIPAAHPPGPHEGHH